jgi:hypothetical protein
MGVGVEGIDAMRYPPKYDPRLDHDVRRTAVGMVLTALLAPALVLAVAYPLTMAGGVALAVAGWAATKRLRRFYRTRRRNNRTRKVCVRRLDVCVEL